MFRRFNNWRKDHFEIMRWLCNVLLLCLWNYAVEQTKEGVFKWWIFNRFYSFFFKSHSESQSYKIKWFHIYRLRTISSTHTQMKVNLWIYQWNYSTNITLFALIIYWPNKIDFSITTKQTSRWVKINITRD